MPIKRNQKIKKSQDKSSKPAPKWFFLILVIIPVIFFVLLEVSLRIFNYGFDNRQWISATEGKLFLNPEIAKRYFYTTKRIPFSNGDIFDEKKKDNAFRVFVLGGSSAAGYPLLPLGSFSHYLQDRLKLLYPSSTIEVVNLSMTAVNSYTIRDLFPGVIEEKPDLIIIYAGHNEYYGALGVGSMESLGTSRRMVNLILYLNRFKTVEFLRNTIQWVMKLFSDNKQATGTLMSRMAKEQSIELYSETYEDGISQFKGNMQDILEIAKEHRVPVILSTLTSNLKDQYPFISIKTKNLPAANEIFKNAKSELNSGDNKKADSLFRYAKDLDCLRFRAPEEMNRVIRSLSREFDLPLVNTDSAFASASPDGIVGNNLMTDHLHPKLQGYFLLGKLFFEKMEQYNYLPAVKPVNLSDAEQDSITIANFNFTKLDSVMSNYRIKLLKNDWPFISIEKKIPSFELLNPKNFNDTLAAEILDDKISWEEAHRKMAAYYLVHRDINSFLTEMDALICQYPVVVEYYDYVAKELIQMKDYARAYKYLKNGYDIKPNAFKTKWLGTISLYNNKLDLAEKYLNECVLYDGKDSQVWYNLAGVYVKRKNYKAALEDVNKALSLSPNYPEAIDLKRQLQSVVK